MVIQLEKTALVHCSGIIAGTNISCFDTKLTRVFK